jgi:hypothetical protein
MRERGTTRDQVIAALEQATPAAAKFGRYRFRRVFPFDSTWNGKRYARKQLDVFAARIANGWFVITVIVKYF